jgi:hypothetical protein
LSNMAMAGVAGANAARQDSNMDFVVNDLLDMSVMCTSPS